MCSWPGGVERCDESKHDEVAFQLAAGDFGSNSLWQTSYLKDNSSMSILYYTSVTRRVGLKCGQRCVKVRKMG